MNSKHVPLNQRGLLYSIPFILLLLIPLLTIVTAWSFEVNAEYGRRTLRSEIDTLFTLRETTLNGISQQMSYEIMHIAYSSAPSASLHDYYLDLAGDPSEIDTLQEKITLIFGTPSTSGPYCQGSFLTYLSTISRLFDGMGFHILYHNDLPSSLYDAGVVYEIPANAIFCPRDNVFLLWGGMTPDTTTGSGPNTPKFAIVFLTRNTSIQNSQNIMWSGGLFGHITRVTFWSDDLFPLIQLEVPALWYSDRLYVTLDRGGNVVSGPSIGNIKFGALIDAKKVGI